MHDVMLKRLNKTDSKYIIVQAGGKGTRLEHLTKNKPKALVPIGNLPMLFYLFRKYPEAHFIVITDYKADVMRKYLAAFADVKYLTIDANGKFGTCAGIQKAIKYIPDEQPFMLIWSDLVLSESFKWPEKGKNYIGLSKGFTCRWRYHGKRFEEIPSNEEGVAGLFIFNDKDIIASVPQEGEFVRWLQEKKMDFSGIALENTKEFGLLSTIEKEKDCFQCRPFNRIYTDEGGAKLIKEGIDAQGHSLAAREIAWYKYVSRKGFSNIPTIYHYTPLTMQRIHGRNIFEYELEANQKRKVLHDLIQCIRQLHALEEAPVDYFSIYEAYITKTWKRLNKVRDLVPYADRECIVVNGKRCRNVFQHKAELEERARELDCNTFCLLHGDNTFSNIMLDENMQPVLIDPRGYFGHTELFGDPAYDWAKLYYSIVGNYDQFNRKRFSLSIHKDGIQLEIKPNGWEAMEDSFFDFLGLDAKKEDIQLIHAIIWLSLTTYAWEDYDSICGAFYNGLYYLEDIL